MGKNIHDSYGDVSNSFGPFERFTIEKLRYFSNNALALSIFVLEKCSFFLNGS